MTKLISVIGVTGNQGGSVARRFLQDARYRVRGITRNPASQEAQKLAAEGVEIFQADLDDVHSLKRAFEGANIIFSVTNYWEPFFRPDCREKAANAGISCRRFAYDVEYQHGKNVADAAAEVVDGLDDNGLLASTLSHAGQCSKAKFTELYHFDAKADIFPDYVNATHPALATKMSLIYTGYFTSSYRYAPKTWFGKQEDGTFQMSLPTAPTAVQPHLCVNEDTGTFVHAVSQMPPGKTYMAAGTLCSWSDFIQTWGQVNNVPVKYQEITRQQFIDAQPDKEFGVEGADMFLYSSDPGYDGGSGNILTAVDIEKAGISCPMKTIKEYFTTHDWSSILNQ